MALELSLLHERFERDDSRNSEDIPVVPLPLSVKTLSLPIGIRYAHPSGLFARSEISLVHQSVERYAAVDVGADVPSELDDESERFANVDVSVGLNLPARDATFRVDIANLFDESYRFQGHDIQSGATTSPRFSPARTVVARVGFSFR